MDEIPTADLVYQRIYACFIDYDPIKRRNAKKYLEQFQKSTYSWAIALELLRQKRDLHSTLFAAQTIRTKVENSLKELPCESLVSLKDTLIVQVGQINRQTDRVIAKQLCMAMAALVLLMDTWEQPIEDLLNSALAQHPENVLPFIQIFTLIAEEIDEDYLHLEKHRKDEVLKQFCASQVLDFLGMSLRQASPDQEVVMSAVLGCFSAWIAVYAVPMENLMENPIVQKVFSLLSFENTSQNLHENAKDCLCTLLKSLESDDGRVQVGPIVEVQIFNGVCGLQSAYNLSVARRDFARSTNFCFVFTAMCEAFLPSMLKSAENPHHTVKALSLVLKCVNHADSKVAEITFSLWKRLSKELFQRQNNRLTYIFGPYVQKLLAALYRHSTINRIDSGFQDELDDLYEFRNKISKLITDTVFIVGAEGYFREMFCVVRSPAATWQDAEAALFMMSNVAKNITPDENDVVPQVVARVLHLQKGTHPAIRSTSMLLLGQLCRWIEKRPHFFNEVLNFLQFWIHRQNGPPSSAAKALISFCKNYPEKMSFNSCGLIRIVSGLKRDTLSNDLAIELLEGVTLVLSKLPLETALNASESEVPNEHGEGRMAATQEQLQELYNTVLSADDIDAVTLALESFAKRFR